MNMPKQIQEGKAVLAIYPGEIKKSDVVFYNPEMRENRDISVLAVKAFSSQTKRKLRVLDVMSATGVRGIRYALEAKSAVNEVIFNDINPYAYELIKKNIALNRLETSYKIHKKEAGCLLHEYRFLGDVVDLDPFGTPAPYLDAAARSVSNKGLIMVTFTDTSVLSGTYPKVALRRYGVNITKGFRPHQELALRVAYASLAKSLARFDKGMVPLVGYVYKHYVRIVAAIDKHKDAATRIYDYIGTKEIKLSDKIYFAKDVWVGKLGDADFVKKMLSFCSSSISPEACVLLNILKDEYEYNFYYDIPFIAKHYRLRLKNVENLLNHFPGIRAHFKKDYVIATNASLEDVISALKY
ncbi:MAG: tRNA (guanine-N2)-dimethyltransferase [Candidatus Nanohaloarchaeota archaeon]|nr:tRNA (guanine-N2)-dimethyltransferase [Candidatus Nanohaloarchaeota archaeon]